MQKRGEVTGGMALKLRETKQLLEELPTTMFVTITSPHSLIKELFTVKGSGTFIKLGSEIEEHHSWKGINRDRMRTLIEASFGSIYPALARLAEDGVMLLHTIGDMGAPSYTSPWIVKYIFPGGHIPSLSDILRSSERAGLRAGERCQVGSSSEDS